MTRRDLLLTGLAICAWPRRARAALAPPPASRPIFRDVAAETGLNFHHFSGSAGDLLMPEILGAGVALIVFGTFIALVPSATPATAALRVPVRSAVPGEPALKGGD